MVMQETIYSNGKAKFATKQNVDEIKSLEKSLIKKDDEYKSNAM